MNVIDQGAVDRLRDEPLGWRHKGLPPDAETVADLVGRRVPLDGFTSPVAVLDGPALAANLDRYAAVEGRGVSRWPMWHRHGYCVPSVPGG